MSENLPDEGRKFTLRLGREAVSDLQWIADQYGGITITEVIRRAVATEKFLLQHQRMGNAILIENRESGKQRELLLR